MEAAKKFGRAALGLFVEIPDEQQGPVTTIKPATGVSVNTTITTTSHDPEMVETLRKRVSSRRTPYTALLEASEKLKAVISDEPTRIKAAFAMLASDGRSVSNLTQSIDVHISDVESERMTFTKTSQNTLNQRAGQLRAQAQQLADQNTQFAQQVETMQKKIIDLNTQINDNTIKAGNLNTEAASIEAEVTEVVKRFEASADLVRDELLQTKNQLSTILV